jgi:diaminopimelate epimerase
MGEPGLEWRDIPLAEPADTLHLEIAAGPLADGVAVGMGNPHAVFFVDHAEGVALEVLGPELEHHGMFPDRANIGIAQITGPDQIRLRVWERGAGITLACGTGACAAAVAAHRRGLAGRKLELELDGGTLWVEWRGDDHVLMTGPAAISFTGTFDDGLVA